MVFIAYLGLILCPLSFQKACVSSLEIEFPSLESDCRSEILLYIIVEEKKLSTILFGSHIWTILNLFSHFFIFLSNSGKLLSWSAALKKNFFLLLWEISNIYKLIRIVLVNPHHPASTYLGILLLFYLFFSTHFYLLLFFILIFS